VGAIDIKRCVTCGEELHPERAERYAYCTKPECRRRNARGLDIVAVGVNKAADQYVVLNDKTTAEAASGRYKKRPDAAGRLDGLPAVRERTGRKPAPEVVPRSARRAAGRWTDAQRNLAVTYRDMGLAPDEIAEKLGVGRHLVTQMLLAVPPRGRSR
jgi:hypothetical protein